MTTTTPTMTIADVWTIATDLIGDIPMDDISVSVSDAGRGYIAVNARESRAGRVLLAVCDLTDRPMLRVTHYANREPHGEIVSVDGDYRGVNLYARHCFRDVSTRDLITEYGAPDRTLLLALAGYQPTEPLARVGKYVVGSTILFSSGGRYRITAVEGDNVTFCHPGDPEDNTTETIADLDAVDVRVLGVPQSDEVTR